MADEASISFTWQTVDQVKAATLTVHAEGVDLDEALDLLADGLQASTGPVYTITRTQVRETQVRDKRGRRRTPGKDPDVTPVVVAAGEPAATRAVKVRGGVVNG